MNILEVYRQYKILPFLQLHQLRVAAVARQISGACTMPVDLEGVTVAALLHDMGNILKFDLSRFPEAYQPEGVGYWRGVQDAFRTKYGSDEHEATLKIAEELHIPERIRSYMRAVGFINVPVTLASTSLEKKICCYADQRVAPLGVVSIQMRIEEGAKRYANHPDKVKDAERQNRSVDGLFEIERQIFSDSTIQPADITNTSIVPLIEAVKACSV